MGEIIHTMRLARMTHGHHGQSSEQRQRVKPGTNRGYRGTLPETGTESRQGDIMAYTVRLRFKVIGTRRDLKMFIRPEYATNTSRDATTYATKEEAETAADSTVEQMEATGRVRFVGADFYTV